MHLFHLTGSLPAVHDASIPVHQRADGTWEVHSYADVQRVLLEPTNFSAQIKDRTDLKEHIIFSSLQNSDPPLHHKLRAILAPALSERAVKRLEARIRPLVEEQVESLRGRRSFEIMDEIAFPLPLKVICLLLGVELSESSFFREQLEQIKRAPSTAEVGQQGALEGYLRALLAQRKRVRQARQDTDVVSLLLDAHHRDEMSEREVLGNLFFLLGAGSETTSHWIAHALLLFDQVGVMEVLREQPELVPKALEEVLRLAPSFPAVQRVTTQSVQLGGQCIPGGNLITARLSAANRDETVFPHPQTCAITRSPNRHLSFAAGAHFCLGAALARLEVRLVLETLLSTFPAIHLDLSRPVRECTGIVQGIQEAHLVCGFDAEQHRTAPTVAIGETTHD